MITKSVAQHLDTLLARYPVLQSVRAEIEAAFCLLESCYESGGKLLIAGNGGSCADSGHIVGELMKGFCKPRHVSPALADALCKADPVRGAALANALQGALPAIALTEHAALNTAFMNDVKDGADMAFAQQINGYGQTGDVFLGITTSGNSRNVLYAAVTARARGLKVIGLTGNGGGALKELADVTICVPSSETYQIQELHLPVYHCLCLMLEERFF